MRYAFSAGKFEYNFKSIGDAHSHLFAMKLGAHHFDYVAENLVATLKSLNVPDDIQTDVVAVVVPLRQIFVDGEKNHKAELVPTDGK
jgi:truncated hemoglobin YjbI